MRKYRKRIYYTEADKALMWDRWLGQGAKAASDPFWNLSLRGVEPQKSVKSLDQGIIAEVVEHIKRGRYSSD